MVVQIQQLSAKAVIYAIYEESRLVHLGEGDSVARPAAYVESHKKLGAGSVTAKFIEVTEDLTSHLALPMALADGVLFRGNLERLLQACYFWQYRQLPQQDKIRGGKGGKPSATGGFIRDIGVLYRVFEVAEELISPDLRKHPWPTLSVAPPAESKPPAQPSGRGRPATREHFLAFWVNISDATANLGHIPALSGAPSYAVETRELIWTHECPNSAR